MLVFLAFLDAFKNNDVLRVGQCICGAPCIFLLSKFLLFVYKLNFLRVYNMQFQVKSNGVAERLFSCCEVSIRVLNSFHFSLGFAVQILCLLIVRR